LNLIESALIFEALGRTPLGLYVFGCKAPDAGNIEILHKYATKEQTRRFLHPLVEGKIRSCFSMTEVDMPGSNPVMMETTAVKDKDDYVINGHKWYTTAADGAAFAIVMAVTDPDAPPHRQASMIIVPTDTPGFNLVRNIPVMGHTGEGYFSHGEILYQNCRVPQNNLLGPEGFGFSIAQERLGPGRIHHCMRWIGICNRAFDLMCSRARDRIIAPGRKLASKQIVQTWIAESAAAIQAARLIVLHAAWKIEQVGAKEARKEISLIKFVVANTMQQVIDLALQVHGGLGMTDDTIIAFFYRHERAARIYDGADEVHKLSLARQILKDFENKTVR
jgi:acyl-CoA dehydrogenase